MSNGHRGKRDLTPEADATVAKEAPASVTLAAREAASVLRHLFELTAFARDPYAHRMRVLRLAVYALVRQADSSEPEMLTFMCGAPPAFITDLINKEVPK